MILNELITNSFKYAFSNGEGGEIYIELRKKGESGCTMVYRDNGAGLPQDIDPHNPTTLGFQIIQSLVTQLNAEFGVSVEEWTTFTLDF